MLQRIIRQTYNLLRIHGAGTAHERHSSLSSSTASMIFCRPRGRCSICAQRQVNSASLTAVRDDGAACRVSLEGQYAQCRAGCAQVGGCRLQPRQCRWAASLWAWTWTQSAPFRASPASLGISPPSRRARSACTVTTVITSRGRGSAEGVVQLRTQSDGALVSRWWLPGRQHGATQ